MENQNTEVDAPKARAIMEAALGKMTTIAQRNHDRLAWQDSHDVQIQHLNDMVVLRHRKIGDEDWQGISLLHDECKATSCVCALIDMVLAAEKIERDAKSKFDAVEGGK